jgi:hypothetical protein
MWCWRASNARGRVDAAHNAIQSAEQIAAQQPFSQLLGYHVLELAHPWLADGAVAHAAYWAEQLAWVHDQTPASVGGQAQMALARVALAESRASEALERLAPLLQQVRITERWGNAIEVLVLQALAYKMHHDEHQALKGWPKQCAWPRGRATSASSPTKAHPWPRCSPGCTTRSGGEDRRHIWIRCWPPSLIANCRLQIVDCR